MADGNRKNLQTKQEGIAYPSEGNGWTQELVAGSSPIRFSYTNGKSGETKSKSITNLGNGEAISDPASK